MNTIVLMYIGIMYTASGDQLDNVTLRGFVE